MNPFSKMYFLISFLVVCLAANGPEIKNAGLFVPSDTPPEEFVMLSAEAKADILCSIAESSYKIFVKVPEIGLGDSRDSIEKIISSRKWLEQTGDVVARILAIRLQYAIDSCILNEMYRKEKQRHGRPLKQAFIKGSLDNTLITVLFQENEIDEEGYIDFALGLDTKIGKFCRQNNYKASDFLTGRVFEEAPEQMKISFLITQRVDEKETEWTEQYNIREIGSGAFVLFSKIVNSKKIAAKVFLPLILNAIDDARDVRLLARIYIKYGGFADKSELQGKIMWSQSLKQRVQAELPNEKIGRITNRRGDSVLLNVLDVTGRMENRVDLDDYELGAYVGSIAIRLLPFIRNSELFPEGLRKTTFIKQGFNGMWLNLPD